MAERGRHSLWQMPVHGAIEVVDTSAPIEADRTNLGVQIAPWLSSAEPGEDIYPGVAFAGVPAAPATVSGDEPPAEPPGRVVSSSVDLGEGRASATVETTRTAAVILKASFDNRWRVTVDGAVVEAQMFAPSLVGRLVPPGRHEVTFQYAPFPRYDLLLLFGAATFAALLVGSRRAARHGRHERGRVARERPLPETADRT